MRKTTKQIDSRPVDHAAFELLEPRLLLSAASDTSEIVIDPSVETAVLASADIGTSEIQTDDITVSDGILSVSPNSASQGDAGLLVTVTLDSNRVPPLPPSQVAPSGMWIGGIAGTSVSRNGTTVSATFTIPADHPAGLADVSVGFVIPTGDTLLYSKSAAFEIVAVQQAPDVFYVDVNNTSGSWDGESWGTAFQSLGEALDAAQAAGEGEIWVADGTYKPTDSTDRTASFELVEGIAVYGGFEGVDETELTDRAPDTYVTVLSGDIGVVGDLSDNSFHVVLGADGAVLDGVTVTGGNADGTLIDSVGGGMLNYDPMSVSITDCLFTGNYANEGGGMFNFNSAIATITDSEFAGNTANRGGAIVNRIAAHAEISDTLFDSNQAAWRGGAVFNDYGSSPTFDACDFTDNHTGGHGGAIYTDDLSSQSGSSPVITGSTFAGNSADFRGGAIANYNRTTPEIRNSTFAGNTAAGGAAIANDYYVTAALSGNTFGPGDDVDTDATSTVSYEGAVAQGILPFEGNSDNSIAAQAAAASLTYNVVDTGQTAFYDNTSQIGAPSIGDAFYGQDAQFTGNAPSYTLSGDGLTVYDNVTDLTWTQSPDIDGDGDIDADDKFSYAEAVSYVDTLNTANFGGFSDWRLPDIKEIYSLIDFSGLDPSGYNGTDTSGLTPFIDTDYFDFGYGDTSSGERIIDAQMASSTLYVGNTGNDGGSTMFGVNFADGRIKGYGLTLFGSDKTFYVYYVRGNTDYGDNDFADNSDGTITDMATGLMWSQDDSGGGMNWEDALAWVQQKNAENYLGHSDWRLPDVKELQSIVDYTRSPQTTSSAALDAVFNITSITIENGSSDYPYFWSGTTHANWQGGGQSGSYVSFGEAMGYMNNWIDVHGAGSQRSDPKDGDPADYPTGHGPQGDAIRIFNFVRLVRDADAVTNQAPVADAGGPYATQTGTPVLLDGSGSSDADGTIVSYEWDLDNDGQYDDAVGAAPSFQSAAGGAFTVGLKVTDDRGAEDTASVTVNVTLAGWTGVAFVDADNTSGPHDGLSWETALTTVQEGLDMASAAGGGEVWVAEGLYTPTSTTDRGISFELRPDVDLYGGFEGDEDSLQQRDWVAFETVLSGDIGVSGDSSNNSYHVVVGADDAVLDGFTITAGQADQLGGGGIANYQASPTIRNSIVKDNNAEKGGGIYNNAGSSPTITNVLLVGNRAETNGGAIANENGSSPVITNATITDNFAGDQGGGLYQGVYDPDSGATSNPTLVNTIVWGNEIGSVGLAEISGWHLNNPSISYSLVGGGYVGAGNLDGDPLPADAEGGDFSLTSGSPAIDSADGDLAPDADIFGSARYDDQDTSDTGSGSPAFADIGACEYQGVVSIPVTVQSVVINSGDAGRSQIVSIRLVLSGDADVSPGALTLHNNSTGEDFSLDSVPFDSASQTWDVSSLALTDGAYTATVSAAGVAAPGGVPMAADHQFEFHVLHCDIDGDQQVGDGDYDAMIGQFGRRGSNLGSDFNADGRVSLADFTIFRGRFGQTLPAVAAPVAAPAYAPAAAPILARSAPAIAEPVASSADLLAESEVVDEPETSPTENVCPGKLDRTTKPRRIRPEDPAPTRTERTEPRSRPRVPRKASDDSQRPSRAGRRFDVDGILPDVLADAAVCMPLEA